MGKEFQITLDILYRENIKTLRYVKRHQINRHIRKIFFWYFKHGIYCIIHHIDKGGECICFRYTTRIIKDICHKTAVLGTAYMYLNLAWKQRSHLFDMFLLFLIKFYHADSIAQKFLENKMMMPLKKCPKPCFGH